MAWSNVGADASTARLIKAAQAAQLAEDLPRDSAKTLVSLARAVRLYLEARDHALARARLERLDLLMATHDDAILREHFERHTREIRRYLAWEHRQ